MRRTTLCFALALILVPYASAEDDRQEFDVPAGHFSQLIAIPVESGFELDCRVNFEDLRFTDVYSPSFSLVFSAADGPISKDEPEPMVRVSFSIADDNGKVFWLNVLNVSGTPHNSAFLGLSEGSSDAALKLYWRDDGLFAFEGASNGEFGKGYVLHPDIVPEFATVFVSGMKGSVVCRSNVLPDD